MRKAIWKLPRKKTLTILIGLPGAGKSTLIKQMMDKDSRGRVIVSSDEIRFELLNYDKSGLDFDNLIEAKVWILLEKAISKAFESPLTNEILLDATNVRRSYRKKYITMARENGFKTRAIVIYKPLNEIKNQNNNRSRKVPENVIDRFYFKFQAPHKEEFDRIVKIGSRKKFIASQKMIAKKSLVLKIDGYDVMKKLNIPQGKAVGDILNQIKDQVIEGKIKNKRKILLNQLVNYEPHH